MIAIIDDLNPIDFQFHYLARDIQAVLHLHGSLTTQFSKQHGLFWYSHLSI